MEKATAKKPCSIHSIPMPKGLMGSIIVPEKGLRDVKLTAIPGVPPNLKNPPAGCRFAERCKYVRPNARRFCASSRIDGERAYRCILPEDELREAYAREAKMPEKDPYA